jgi:hypothetical protein
MLCNRRNRWAPLLCQGFSLDRFEGSLPSQTFSNASPSTPYLGLSSASGSRACFHCLVSSAPGLSISSSSLTRDSPLFLGSTAEAESLGLNSSRISSPSFLPFVRLNQSVIINVRLRHNLHKSFRSGFVPTYTSLLPCADPSCFFCNVAFNYEVYKLTSIRFGRTRFRRMVTERFLGHRSTTCSSI